MSPSMGQYVKKCRERAGLNIAQLARRCGWGWVCMESIEKRGPSSVEQVFKLAKALKVDPQLIMEA